MKKNKVEHMMKLKEQRGISLLSLTITILILVIITSILVYNAKNSIAIRNYKNLEKDLEVLTDRVELYYEKNGVLPLGVEYLNRNFYSQKQGNDNDVYYVIDLNYLEGLSLNFGGGFFDISTSEDTYNIKDVYIINENSHHIYYAEGILVDGETYYTIAEDTQITLNNYVSDDIYVTLYNDGTLAFAKSSATINGKSVKKSYGNIKGNTFTSLTSVPWNENRTDIQTVKVINALNVTDMGYWFTNCSNLTSIELEKFETTNLTNMASTFSGCTSLTNIDFTDFDTSNVENMSSLFKDCNQIETLNLVGFDTSSVTNMSSMFENCTNLTSLNISRFDTSKVTNMSYMFRKCSKLTQININKFNTSQVTNMAYMFEGCTNLASLNLTYFDTSKVTTMTYMFSSCSALTELNLVSFNTKKVTTMAYIFNGCSNIEHIYVNSSIWSTSQATTTNMFTNCGVSTVTAVL